MIPSNNNNNDIFKDIFTHKVTFVHVLILHTIIHTFILV